MCLSSKIKTILTVCVTSLIYLHELPNNLGFVVLTGKRRQTERRRLQLYGKEAVENLKCSNLEPMLICPMSGSEYFFHIPFFVELKFNFDCQYMYINDV